MSAAIQTFDLGKAYPVFPSSPHRLLHTLLPSFRRQIAQQWALRHVSFSLQPRQTLGIIGRNGSGKSTLLQLLARILAPSEGTLEIHGKVAALLELGAGFNPEFTGRENVTLNAHLFGLSRAQIAERFSLIAAFADIGEYMDRPVKTYSSGMYLRLAFAVVAHVDAEILIVDEALSVGDAFFTQKCMRFLRAFKATGTLLFVSHDSAAVINLCDQVLWLDQGQPKALGPAKAVCEQYLATFVQDAAPAMTSSPMVESQPIASESGNAFGEGGATITRVALAAKDAPVSVISGGEQVILQIGVMASSRIKRPLVGFFIKDRLGQTLFGDNTAASCPLPAVVEIGESIQATFCFQMPTLPPGEYTIAAAIADGTQVEHRMLHWVHDATMFTSIATTHHQGLVGIPMQRIILEKS